MLWVKDRRRGKYAVTGLLAKMLAAATRRAKMVQGTRHFDSIAVYAVAVCDRTQPAHGIVVLEVGSRGTFHGRGEEGCKQQRKQQK